MKYLLLLSFLFLQGCSLLFVAKGGTRYVRSKEGSGPQASSLEKQMARVQVLEYKVRKGDSLPAIAERYYGKASKAASLAKANGLAEGQALKPGKVLKIAAPLYYPDPNAPVPVPAKAPKESGKAKGQGLSPAPIPKSEKIARPRTNGAFGPGERLKFEVRVLGVLGGYASLEVGGHVQVSERPCLPLTARANSVFPLTSLFPVSDVQTSYFDSVDFLSWKFENNVHEGGYKARNLELYDQIRHKLSRKHNDEAPETLDIAPFSQDIISCFYYFRLLPMEAGKTYDVPTQSGGKNYHLIVKVGQREKVTVPAGTFDCLKVKPLIQQGTVFRNNEDIDLWITDDERHVPVKIKSGIVIGSIDVDLLDATLPNVEK